MINLDNMNEQIDVTGVTIYNRGEFAKAIAPTKYLSKRELLENLISATYKLELTAKLRRQSET